MHIRAETYVDAYTSSLESHDMLIGKHNVLYIQFRESHDMLIGKHNGRVRIRKYSNAAYSVS